MDVVPLISSKLTDVSIIRLDSPAVYSFPANCNVIGSVVLSIDFGVIRNQGRKRNLSSSSACCIFIKFKSLSVPILLFNIYSK